MDFLTQLIDRSLLVEDRALLARDRETNGQPPVTVINTSGAGGLVALAGRRPEHLRVVAVDNTVRDTVDPAQNIARIAAAARELDPEITVRVSIPTDCADFDDAVATVEAEGLQGLLTDSGGPADTTTQLRAFVEADLPFAATVDSADGLVSLLLTLDALIGDASVDEASKLLSGPVEAAQRELITVWEEQRQARIRRRLTAVRSTDVAALLGELPAI